VFAWSLVFNRNLRMPVGRVVCVGETYKDFLENRQGVVKGQESGMGFREIFGLGRKDDMDGEEHK